MHRYALAALTVLHLAAPAAPAQQAPTDPRATPIAQNAAEVARRVDQHLRRLVAFGFSGAILIANDWQVVLSRIDTVDSSGATVIRKDAFGQVLLSEGYGMADRENSIPASANTVFDIGSITKQFTAAAILKLEMEGKLSVTDSVGRWFESVPDDKRGMTIHHLLTHTAGLRGDFGADYEVAERDSLARVILTSPLNAPPPAPYDYSNAGYSLLAMIVEKASGMPYEQYLREKIFRPAGLTRTGYRSVNWQPGELAVGYRAGQRWGTPTDKLWASDGPYWNLRGNGGILSTLPDMYAWHRALEGDAILSAEAKRKLWTPHVPEGPGAESHYGYGWAIFRTPRNTQLIAHNGGNGIFFADFRRYVDEGVVFLIASSVSEASGATVQQQLLRLIFGGEYGEPPVVATDVAPSPMLAGSYRLSPTSAINIELVGDKLRASSSGQEAFLLLRGIQNDPALEPLGAAAVRAIEAAERGDMTTFRAVFDTPERGEEFVRQHAEFSQAMTARFGAFRAAEAIGTVRRGERPVTTVRLRYERGEQNVLVWFAGDRIVDIVTTRIPPYFDLLPVSATEWVAYEFATGRTLRVLFDGDRLIVNTPQGGVAAQRSVPITPKS